MKISDLEIALKLWHEEKFSVPSVELSQYVEKLAEEYGELQSAMLSGDDFNIAEECIDMIFILCHIVRTQTFTNVNDEAKRKLDIIYDRLDK